MTLKFTSFFFLFSWRIHFVLRFLPHSLLFLNFYIFFDLLYLNILQFILPLWSLSRSFSDCDVFHLLCGLRNIMRMRYNRGITWCAKVPFNDKYIMNIHSYIACCIAIHLDEVRAAEQPLNPMTQCVYWLVLIRCIKCGMLNVAGAIDNVVLLIACMCFCLCSVLCSTTSLTGMSN